MYAIHAHAPHSSARLLYFTLLFVGTFGLLVLHTTRVFARPVLAFSFTCGGYATSCGTCACASLSSRVTAGVRPLIVVGRGLLHTTHRRGRSSHLLLCSINSRQARGARGVSGQRLQARGHVVPVLIGDIVECAVEDALLSYTSKD